MIENARMLQNLLTKSGYLTLAAGGFVRDHLLGREPKDIDLATEALPEQVRDILVANNIRVEDTGLKHGTVSAIIDKIPYEITTLRIDKKCNGREAEVVFIKSFEEDAKRRDFTINAMFMDLETGKILDYVNGQEDLRKEILRFVRNPVDRITEDYLRILRLFRFASQLGFQIDPDAARYATKYLPYMTTYISTERIYTEMSKLIVGKGVFYILNTYKDLLFHVFPEMYLTVGFQQNNPYHIYDVYEHTLHGLNFLKQFNNPTLSFAHLFHDVAKPLCHTTKWNDENKCIDHFYDHEYHGAKVTQRICHRLKFSSDDTKKIYFLVANHRRLTCASSNKAMKKLIQECAEAGSKNWIWDLYKILEADKAGQAPSDFDLRLVGSHIKECLESFEKTKIESPMSGSVIKDIFKIKDGPNIGRIKDYLVAQVIEGTVDPKNVEEVWAATLKFVVENNLS